MFFRHAEEILPTKIREEELESYYIETILPKKMKLDVDYAARATFRIAMALLFSTAIEVIFRHGSWTRPVHPTSHQAIPINSAILASENPARQQDPLAG